MFFILIHPPFPVPHRKTIAWLKQKNRQQIKSIVKSFKTSFFFVLLSRLLAWMLKAKKARERARNPERLISITWLDMLSTSSDENWYYVDINTRKWRLIEFLQRTKLVERIRQQRGSRLSPHTKKKQHTLRWNRSMLPVVECELTMLVCLRMRSIFSFCLERKSQSNQLARKITSEQ